MWAMRALLSRILISPCSRANVSRASYQFPELKESDLVEYHVFGGGPGGQKVNKTANRVVLKHIPTGIQVSNQETRYLEQNRKLARQSLIYKIDFALNGESSFLAQQLRERREQGRKNLSRARKLANKREKYQELYAEHQKEMAAKASQQNCEEK